MKRVIVCCDGTWNKPGSKDRGEIVKTNVQKIYEAIDTSNSKVKQVKYYGQGVGTGFSARDHFVGGSTGMGIDKNIQDAYKFIMWNYEPGDELYLFGFSRGAYTVRSLAGLIRNCGIMKPEYLHLVTEAYHLYRDRTRLTHPDSDLMKAFKKSYGIDKEDTIIKFVGVWDTVGALGIPLRWFEKVNKKYKFHDVKLSSQIRYAYHALAIDEKRKIFDPALWEVSQKDPLETSPQQTCEQVWFPGVHSNVGGGYKNCGLSNATLLWMIDKAIKAGEANGAGLEFDAKGLAEIKADSCDELRNSATGIYYFTPKKVREVNSGIATRLDVDTGKKVIEKVQRNESIHYTCFERRHKYKEYNPANIAKALTTDTPFDPQKDKWDKAWLAYISAPGNTG